MIYRRFTALLSAYLAIITPVFGQETAPITQVPAAFKVVPLNSGDVLNVRAGPGVGFADIGDLSEGAQFEVTAFDPEAGWARIHFNEQAGWVSARFIEPVATPLMPQSGLPANFQCFGTEPFWNSTLTDGDDFVFETMDGGVTSSTVEWEGRSVNNPTRLGFYSEDWAVFAEKKSCSDGMSDRIYGIRVDVMSTKGGGLYSGCCRLNLRQPG